MRKIILPVLGIFLVLSLSGYGLAENTFQTSFVVALIAAAIVGTAVWVLYLLNKNIPVIKTYAAEFAEMEVETQDSASF